MKLSNTGYTYELRLEFGGWRMTTEISVKVLAVVFSEMYGGWLGRAVGSGHGGMWWECAASVVAGKYTRYARPIQRYINQHSAVVTSQLVAARPNPARSRW